MQIAQFCVAGKTKKPVKELFLANYTSAHVEVSYAESNIKAPHSHIKIRRINLGCPDG